MTKCLRFIWIALLVSGPANAVWTGSIPPVAQDAAKWKSLLEGMNQHDMAYGSLAASYRMLTFFSDLPSKELAYETIIGLIDRGYPFSTRSFFVTGDIEPEPGNDFANSYNLYKGLLSRDKGMTKWADHYFANVDKDKFPKYLFYSALDSYLQHDRETAVKTLQKILAMNLGMQNEVLVTRTARTLARIEFELGQYDKSFDIYHSFLLRLNPVVPSDWLEAAWNLYYLKRYDEALGLLFNLESHSLGQIDLEKYVVRALIYQSLCDTERMDALTRSFENDFGKTIHAIKSGETLSKLPQLKTIFFSGNSDYEEAALTLNELQRESHAVQQLPSDLQKLAKYLYMSEGKMLTAKIGSYNEKALNAVATYLVNTTESLRFLKFDVSRQRYNPDSVFQEKAQTAQSRSESTQEAGMEMHSNRVTGDLWRDERTEYKAVLKNRCAN